MTTVASRQTNKPPPFTKGHPTYPYTFSDATVGIHLPACQTTHPSPHRNKGALVRYSAITYLTECLEEGLTLADALKRAATKPWPSDHGRCYAERTLEDWWYTYQKDGFTALTQDPRQDLGQSRALTLQQQEWLIAQRESYPDIPSKSPTNDGGSKPKAISSLLSPPSIAFSEM